MKKNLRSYLQSVKRYASPLRYPGGKAGLAPFIGRILRANSLNACVYYEPFAGGAGAALQLLRTGEVSSVHLNDADFRIYILWKAIFEQNEQFADTVRSATLSIREWHKQLYICTNPKAYTKFEVAYATFFMNRCNRSGIILGSRPIGGLNQAGAFSIEARFNKIALAARINALASLKDTVFLYNYDALEFLKFKLPKGKARTKIFVYLDPPYYDKGNRLYLNYYSAADHRNLAIYVQRQKILHWLMSYDNVVAIATLYSSLVRGFVDARYSMQIPRLSKELLIAPKILEIPRK